MQTKSILLAMVNQVGKTEGKKRIKEYNIRESSYHLGCIIIQKIYRREKVILFASVTCTSYVFQKSHESSDAPFANRNMKVVSLFQQKHTPSIICLV